MPNTNEQTVFEWEANRPVDDTITIPGSHRRFNWYQHEIVETADELVSGCFELEEDELPFELNETLFVHLPEDTNREEEVTVSKSEIFMILDGNWEAEGMSSPERDIGVLTVRYPYSKHPSVSDHLITHPNRLIRELQEIPNTGAARRGLCDFLKST